MSFRIAIDGTFASGKGTLAKRLAAHYGLPHLDTGKIYRATALAVLEAGGDPEVEADGVAGVKAADFGRLDDPRLVGNTIANAASKVSVHPAVRKALLEMQREFATDNPKGGAVLDGRDIGTVILPDAEVKLFVDADAKVRAKRRYAELSARGDEVTEAEILRSLEERDARDRNRAIAPLKPAVDAHLLDTTDLSIDRAFERARDIVEAARAVL